jgi:hypothetical protein
VPLPAHIYETVEVFGCVVQVQSRHFGGEVVDGYDGPHWICHFEFLLERLGCCCAKMEAMWRGKIRAFT